MDLEKKITGLAVLEQGVLEPVSGSHLERTVLSLEQEQTVRKAVLSAERRGWCVQ